MVRRTASLISRPMRVPTILVLACLAAAAAGCGGDDDERAQRPPAPVELDVTAPADMAVVQSETVEVRGHGGARGRARCACWGSGRTSAAGRSAPRCALEPGANVIDVIATARGRGTAMTAFRVTREVPVKVPDLDGLEAPEVEEQLSDAGLRADITERGGLLEELLPGEPAVCEQDPEPGAEVRRGTTVRVEVSKSC